MRIDIEIKNYRCFPDSNPARLTIQNGATAFLGVNNSGKSSFLRFFFELRPLFSRLSPPSHDARLVEQTGAFLAGAQPLPFEAEPAILREPLAVFSDRNDRDLTVTLAIEPSGGEDGSPPLAVPHKLILRLSRQPEVSWSAELRVDGHELRGPGGSLSDGVLSVDGAGQVNIRTLLEAIRRLGSTCYIGPFRNLVAGQRYFDIETGPLAIAVWDGLKRGSTQSDYQRSRRITEALKRIFQYDDLDINASRDGQTLQVSIEGQRYNLDELGAGFSQFFIVLLNTAAREFSFVLIDEPELNLHPSLQRDFLTTLESFASQGIVFATHSIGLARSSAQWLYSFRRVGQGVSEVQPYAKTPDLVEFLGEMSFSTYEELGYEKLLLVEGVTEIKCVQQFLRFFGRDADVVLVPLGGGQMITANRQAEIHELKRLCPDVHCLIDSERSAPGEQLSQDRQGFVDACLKEGIDCRVLERRAVENYFSEEAIHRVLGQKYRALAPHESLDELDLRWAKADNWRIASQMKPTDLDGTDLGQFLQNL
jgi:predicted ATPase